MIQVKKKSVERRTPKNIRGSWRIVRESRKRKEKMMKLIESVKPRNK